MLALLNRRPSTRIVKFGVVGLIGVAVNLALVQLLYVDLHVMAPIASAIAVEVAIINNFIWNNRWTFGERTFDRTRFVRYNVTSLGGLLLTTLIFTGLMSFFSLPYVIADLIGIGAATAWNFGASVRWTWAAQP